MRPPLPWLLVAVTLPALAPPALAAGDPVLARYQGGELRASELSGRALDSLPAEGRAAALCAGAYREIFSRSGARQALDQQPEFVEALAVARRRLAAELYRRKREPNFAGRITAEELAAEWRRRSQPGGDLHQPGQVDMDVIFLRCGVLPAERQGCLTRAAEIDRRLQDGEAFTEIVGQERRHSGNANGSYSAAPLERLSPELRQLATKTQRRTLSPWLETPNGLFRLQVLDRRGAAPRPFTEVEDELRRGLVESRRRVWEEEERRRLDPRSKADIEEILEAAADRAGDCQDPAFVARLEKEKERLLAARAYVLDRHSRPADAELEALRQERAHELEELVLLVFSLPFGDSRRSWARAGEIAETLSRGAADMPATLAALPTRFAELRVEQVGPLSRRALSETLPDFAKALEGVAAGDWRGPIPLAGEGLWPLLRKPAVARETAPAGRSLVFAALLQCSLPPLGQLRGELLQPRIAELEAGGAYCHELLGRRFAFTILPGP